MVLTGKVWPVHPQPLPDELLSSWLVRFARGNAQKLQTFTRLTVGKTQVWNRDIDKSARLPLLRALSKKSGISVEALKQTTLKPFEGWLYEHHNAFGFQRWILSAGIYHRVRRCYGLQYCPQCLAEDDDPYFRRHWRLALTVCCLKHRCSLLDACPYCQQPVIFFRGDYRDKELPNLDPITLCWNCRRDLRRVPVKEVDKSLVVLQRFLMGVLKRGYCDVHPYGPVYSHLYFDVLNCIACKLSMRGRRSDRLWGSSLRTIEIPSASFDKQRVGARQTILLRLGTLIVDWPVPLLIECRRSRVSATIICADFKTVPYWFEQSIFTLRSSVHGFKLSKNARQCREIPT